MIPHIQRMWSIDFISSGGEPFYRRVECTKTWWHESSTIVTIAPTLSYNKPRSCSFRTKIIKRIKTSGGDGSLSSAFLIMMIAGPKSGYYTSGKPGRQQGMNPLVEVARLSLSYGGNWEPTYSSRVCSLKTVGIPGYDKGSVYDHGDSRFPHDHRYNRLSGGAHIAALQYQSPTRMISISNHPMNPGMPGDAYGNSNVNCNDSQSVKARLSFYGGYTDLPGRNPSIWIKPVLPWGSLGWETGYMGYAYGGTYVFSRPDTRLSMEVHQ